MPTTSINEGLAAVMAHVQTLSADAVASYKRACDTVNRQYAESDCGAVDVFLNAEIREALVLSPKRQRTADRYIHRVLGMLEDFACGAPFKLRHATDCRYKHSLDARHRQMIDDFADSLNMSEGTTRAIMSVTRSFFRVLQDEGICNPCEVDTVIFHRFLMAEAPSHKGSMGNVMYALRKVCNYLRVSGYTGIPDDPVPFTLPSKRSRVLPAFSAEDTEAILSSPNKETASGKRDFAVLLLASTTGMRASDIGGLRLGDIDWHKLTVCFQQRKTGGSLALPLMPGVAKAIADYVLKGRPESCFDKVFLTSTPPYRALGGGSLSNILYKHMRLSGVAKSPHDGKAFHSFRRSMGMWLLESGESVDMISQVLGHRSKEVLARYLPLSPDSLEVCALGFEGIGVASEVYL